jgi:predicted porin
LTWRSASEQRQRLRKYLSQDGSGSRLGFRGVEDLGGGLSALFWIEHRDRDTGIVGGGLDLAAAASGTLVA